MNNQLEPKKSILKSMLNILMHPICILLIVNVLVYGIFVPFLGFYWDDLDFYWFHLDAGNYGLSQYFSHDGPFLGVLYQINFSILGNNPWHWQIFILFWRWICSIGFFFLFRQLFRQNQKHALAGALVFLLYPGFSQQFIALCYGHYFIALTSLVFSLGISLYVVEHKQKRPLLVILAVLLAIINLITTEYFFALELIRPFLIWYMLSGQKKRFSTTLKYWWPFSLALIAGVIWRFVIFKYQTTAYNFQILNDLLSQPLKTIGGLLVQVTQNLWLTIIATWKNVFSFPSFSQFGKTVSFIYIGITLLLVVVFLFAFLTKSRKDQETPYREAVGIIAIGLIACLLGGIPYWSTGLMLGGNFPTDRFALSFILGSALVFCGIISLIPLKPTRLLRPILLVVLLALAGGLQVRYGITYKRDWEALQRFIWQLSWRVPAIEPDTLVLSNELPLVYYSDLSVTAPLNILYDKEESKERTSYLYYYPSGRKTDPDALTLSADFPIEQDVSVGTFTGNTNRSLTLYYEPPGCLRIIDPEIEMDNWMLPLYIRQTAALSMDGYELINSSSDPNRDPILFEGETTEGWCYFFEKADLARQQGNWTQVTAIANQVITGKERPTDPMERFVYIEGYAHTGNWQQAKQLSETTLAVTGVMKPPLCQLWKRIDRETPLSIEKAEVISQIYDLLSCSSE